VLLASVDHPPATVLAAIVIPVDSNKNAPWGAVEFIAYGNDVRIPPMTFEIFKDMLNRHQFKRGVISGMKLVRDFSYYDTVLQVNDAATLGTAIRGVIVINSERIEFGSRTGNLLSNLRRGVFGTAIAEIHARGSDVIDISDSETIPYTEVQNKFDFYANGSNRLFGPLPFVPGKTVINNWYRNSIPTGYGQCNEVEVFVGGRRLIKNPVNIYNEQLGLESPVNGDPLVEAEFSVDGVTAEVRLTNAPSAGIRVTIIQRKGNTWYELDNNGIPLSLGNSQTTIAKFIQQRSSLLPSFNETLRDVLNTQSGDTIDDQNDNPIEY
jgi:hypothetical protein